MSTIENYNYKIFSRFNENWFYLWKEKEKNKTPLCFLPNCEPINDLRDISSPWQRKTKHLAAVKSDKLP